MYLDNQARSGSPKTVDSEVVCQAIEANLVSCTWRVSGKFGILQSILIRDLLNLGKRIQLLNCPSSYQNIAKYLTHPCIKWFGLVWFGGISTPIGYLMPNPLHTYI